MNFLARYQSLKKTISETASQCGRNAQEITLLVVTKEQSLNVIKEAYQAGCRLFGESRIQEVIPKMETLPKDIQWHWIGALQNNKVNKAIGLFSLIHSVDSVELAQKISLASQRKEIVTSVLLQVNISGESSKQGLSLQEWKDQFTSVKGLPNLQIEGLMTIGPLKEDERQIRSNFRKLRELKEELQERAAKPELFRHLSMGMSNDYPIAIQEGATILRVGSALFDTRPLA